MNWRKNLWSLWFGCLISSSCYTMILPFLPLYLFDLGADKASISLWSGLIFSATFFVSAIMSPYWGRRADKSGKRLMLLRAGFSLAAVYLLGAFVNSPLELLSARLLQGFATGFVPAALAIISSSAPEEKMGFSLGLMQTATLTGTIIGPMFGGILSHLFGIRASFVVASAIMFLGTIAVRVLVTEPKRSADLAQGGSILHDFKLAFNNRALLGTLVLLLIAQMVIMLMQPMITLYITELQGRLEGAVLASGFVFSLAGIAGAIAAPLWGKLGQSTGFFRILVIVFIGAGVFNSLLCLSQGIWTFALLQFMFGFFIAGVNPAVNTIAVINTDPGFRGRIFGLMMSANQLGSMIGPLFGGIIGMWVSIKLMFLYTGLFLIFMGVLLWYRYALEDVGVAGRQVSH